MFPQPIAITHVMEPVLPGAYAVATVGGLADDTTAYAFAVPDAPAGEPGGTLPVGEARPVPIVQRTGECVTLDVPAGEFGVLALSTSPTFDDTAWIANRPRLDWAHPERAVAGEPFRLLGRNVVGADRYPTADPEYPVSFGGLLEGDTRVLARRQGESAFIEIPVEASSGYEARLAIPAGLAPGTYDFFAHNGHGGPLGWSTPLAVEVAAAEPWPDDVFAVEDYLAQTGGLEEAIAAALADIARNGGGTLAFAARTYHITRTIVLPAKTVLRGAGRERTRLQLPEGPGPKPPYVAVTGDGDFAVEDVSIAGVHAPLLICAPAFAPETFDEAFLHEPLLRPQRAQNVAVRRVHLAQSIMQHCDRRPDKEHLARMQDYVMSHGLEYGGFKGIFFKGTGLAVEDSVVYGGGTCVDGNRSQHLRLSRNVLKAGPAGYALHAYSRLNWAEDGSGARIEGNYCREILVEDNEITAYSERARGLVAVSFGGANIHFARNHVHDIQATFDAEAVLTHLWSARWAEPSIRMLTPTTGEIIDPTGEVAHEWLEGAQIDIADGRGLGQVRTIVRRDGDRFEIDRPWRVNPDETSDIVFTAPPLFERMVFVDNRVVTQAINFIIWAQSRDTVLDGNYTADSPGITLWSVRWPGDQKVWGGVLFTSVINNVMDRGWSSPPRGQALAGAVGFFLRSCKNPTCTDEGYDYLGVVVRNNHATNNTGIGVPVTFREGDRPWHCRDAGIVVEGNLCTDSVVGIAIEHGARAVERNNRCRNVAYPLTWEKAPD
ncbi:MAG: hypothetical protein ACYC6A_04950 [Armatimonadota bacterium]